MAMRGIDSNQCYNMVLEKARGDQEKMSGMITEAHHQMEMILGSGLKFIGALAGMLLGGCGGGCGGI